MGVTCRLYRDGQLESHSLDTERIDEILQEPGAMVWLDLEEPDEAAVAMVGREFGFHELALEDCLHPHQRPKIESYGEYFFLVAYGVTAQRTGPDRTELVTHEIGAFVGRNYLVTVRKSPGYDLAQVVKRWDVDEALAREGGGFLLYILLDEVVDGYFDALDVLEDVSGDLEDRVLGETEEPDAQLHLFRLKKELTQFRRCAAPLRDVLDVMQRRLVDVVTVPLEPYYRDVYDHVLRATDFADTLRDILSTAVEAHLTVVSNRLNLILKSLSSWAAIILIPTLIAGIYGMNFQHMPELGWLFGYPFALGVMGLAAFLLYRVFKRRDWL